ncbi:membrane or secreted protein [gut metagenome]|uniref:Membrane or secreted protein n=1 Tax=gut metagenome TaxID=749906 RepID=J9G8Y5_9ZZZZ
MSSPSLKRTIVSFSIFISLSIAALPMVFQNTQLAVKAAIPPFNTLSTQLDGKHIKQLLRHWIGCKGSYHTQTLDSCFQVRTAKGIKGFHFIPVHLHCVSLLKV